MALKKKTAAKKKIVKKKKVNGRPLKYTPASLKLEIQKYFQDCKDEQQNPLLSGLCLHLNITRETFSEWRTNESKGFSDIIKKSRLMVEHSLEQLSLKNNAGAMFNLKCNFGYQEKQSLELSGPDGKPIDVNTTSKQDEEFARIYSKAVFDHLKGK